MSFISKISFILFISISIISCNTDKKNTSKTSNKESVKDEVVQSNTDLYNSKGYKLMEEKCFICHFKTPDSAKKDAMIAPPMLRVQEHYKPSFPTEEKFVAAVTKWVMNPIEDETLMPGTIRKFDLMPHLNYNKEDVELIAKTLYHIDLGSMPKMLTHAKLELNNGKKWQVKKSTMDKVVKINEELNNFNSDTIEDYQKLGKDLFNNAKTILLDDSYSGAKLDQLHSFFNKVEENMHLLMNVSNIEEAKKQQKILQKKFSNFSTYFEAN